MSHWNWGIFSFSFPELIKSKYIVSLTWIEEDDGRRRNPNPMVVFKHTKPVKFSNSTIQSDSTQQFWTIFTNARIFKAICKIQKEIVPGYTPTTPIPIQSSMRRINNHQLVDDSNWLNAHWSYFSVVSFVIAFWLLLFRSCFFRSFLICWTFLKAVSFNTRNTCKELFERLCQCNSEALRLGQVCCIVYAFTLSLSLILTRSLPISVW